jgi:Xaa-Pro dipeptidase
MRTRLELPRLSLAERDRRWQMVRSAMRDKALDCLLLFGFPANWDVSTANARYISHIGGNAAFNVTIFPLEDEPTSFVLMPTFVEYWKRAQDWVSDIRARKGTWAASIAGRIRELGLEKARIGVDGLAGPLDPDGWFPHSVYLEMTGLLPQVEIVNTDDMLEKMRAVKSTEEIGVLEKAAQLGDLMLDACLRTAKPGVKECEVYARMMEVMLANGGEEPTLFLWAADAHPLPHPFRLPTQRALEPGDIITCEMHPKYGGYYTHVERTFCIGEPQPEYRRIYEGCLSAYRKGMELFKPGVKIVDAIGAIRSVIESKGLGICEAGMHGHGLSSLEYPRYRLHALQSDASTLDTMVSTLRPGMVFALNIDLVDPAWRNGETGCVFGETIMITENAARRMHTFPLEFQVIPF